MTHARTDILRGAYALLLTPFTESGAVDWLAYERYVDWQLARSPHALFAVCGSSEMKTLAPDERLRLIELAVSHAGSTPVVATGNLQEAYSDQVAELHAIEQTGVAAVVATTRGLGADQSQLAAYLSRLAQETELPLLAYEYPGYPDHAIAADTYGQLVAAGAIAGVKDTTCTIEAITAKVTQAPSSLVLQANTSLLTESIRRGAAGAMTIASTVGVERVRRVWDEATGAQVEGRAQAQLSVVDALLSGGFPATGKYLLQLAGLPFTPRTRGGAKLSPARRAALEQWHASVATAAVGDMSQQTVPA